MSVIAGASRRRVAVVTGSRAEFGLLEPVMRAVRDHPALELACVVAGAHLLPPALTHREVEAAFPVAAVAPMQRASEVGRTADAAALGRGIEAFAAVFDRLAPAWVVALGDRIEAFAAAAAGSVGGIAVAHLHGGDRAEGVADEAMRHAITKLAHLHLPATEQSAERIARMGEPRERVRVVGSPAIDGLMSVRAMDDGRYAELGAPEAVFLMHPIGRSDAEEEEAAAAALAALRGRRVLAMRPNHDPGRAGIVRAIDRAGVRALDHLPRGQWLALLRRLAEGDGTGARGVLVGNSSAGLIEAAGLATGGASALAAVDIGRRQGGRERPGNVAHAAAETEDAVRAAIAEATARSLRGMAHPYGEGRAGAQTAAALASVNPGEAGFLRKHNAY